MKKLSALLLILLTTVMLSACTAFYDDSTQTYPQEATYQTTVFLQGKNGILITAERLAEWQAQIQTLIVGSSADTVNPKITAVDCTPDATTDFSEPFPVNLTLANVPESTARKVVRPFRITYTETLYNPIALLPTSDNFEYVIGYTFERRHSETNADAVTMDEDGNYIYFWTSSDPLQIINVYPNRPLYYLLVVVGAVLIGALIYFINRYSDCKKRKMSV